MIIRTRDCEENEQRAIIEKTDGCESRRFYCRCHARTIGLSLKDRTGFSAHTQVTRLYVRESDGVEFDQVLLEKDGSGEAEGEGVLCGVGNAGKIKSLEFF